MGPNIIENEGKPEFVSLPFSEYRQLAEAAGNKTALAEIRKHLRSGNEPKFALIPIGRYRRLLAAVEATS